MSRRAKIYPGEEWKNYPKIKLWYRDRLILRWVSLTGSPMDNEGQRLNDWMQRQIAQTKMMVSTSHKEKEMVNPSKASEQASKQAKGGAKSVRKTQDYSGSSLREQIPDLQGHAGSTTTRPRSRDARGKDIGGPHETSPSQRHRRDQQPLAHGRLFQLGAVSISGYASCGTAVHWRGRCRFCPIQLAALAVTRIDLSTFP